MVSRIRVSSAAPPSNSNQNLVVLFDGDCVLCNGWARFIAARDPGCQIALGAQQSPAGRERLQAADAPQDLSSIVVITPEGVMQKSDAVFRVLAALSFPWPILCLLRIVPRVVRDWVYGFIARHRYRLFGKYEDGQCPLPTAAMRARTID